MSAGAGVPDVDVDGSGVPGAPATRVTPMLGRLMLLTTAAVWGTSYTFSKHVLNAMPLQWMMVCRTVVGALLVGVIFLPRLRRVRLRNLLMPGFILAVTYWLAFTVQMRGLDYTAPGHNAFLTATYCVFVPFLMWGLTRRRPRLQHVVAAVVCLVGVGFVSLGGEVGAGAGVVGAGAGAGAGVGVAGVASAASPALGSFLGVGVGDWVSLAGGMLFGVNITLTGWLSRKFDPIALTFVEFCMSTVMFLAAALLTEGGFDPSWMRPDVVGSLLYLAAGSTVIAQICESVGMRVVPAAQGSIIMCTESLFSFLFSMALTGERATVPALVGFAVIFASMVFSELPMPARRRAKDALTETL